MKKKKPTRIEMNQKRVEILAWARLNNLIVDPSKGMELAVENYFKFGYCPCDPTKSRTNCPCLESLSDIKKTGRCLCKLYWKDLDTYISTIQVREVEEGTPQKN